MANKRIERKDIVAGDAISSITSELVELESQLIKITKGFEALIKVNPLKTAEDFSSFNKNAQSANATLKALNATQKKLTESRQNDALELASAKVQLQERNKQLKEEAKEQLGLISIYKKQSDKLRDLKNAYKDATLSGKKSRKELDKMRKAVIKLDNELVDLDNSVNDSFRNIGKYSQALDKTKKQLLKVAAAGALAGGAFQSVKGSLEASEEGSEDLRKASGKLDATLSVTKNTIATAALELFDFTKAIVTGEKTWDKMADSFTKTNAAIDNYGKNVDKATDASDGAVESTIKLEALTRKYGKEVAILSARIEAQNAIAGDTTRGMDSIAAATEEALRLEILRSAKLQEIAQKELDIINNQIKAKGKDANVLDLKNQASAKEIELIGIKNDSRIFEIEQNKLLSENERDRFEKGLDFALDLFDTQKTLNERGIADENKTFIERSELLKRTKVLANEAFEEQIRLAEKQTGKKLKLNELVALDDEKLIFARVSNATQDEIVQQRILDIIRDRKTAVLDLVDAETDLSNAIKEANDENSEDFRGYLREREELENTFTDSLLSSQQLEIQAVQDKYFKLIEAAKEYGEEFVSLEKMREAEIAKINKKSEDDTKKKADDKQDASVANANKIASAINDSLNQVSDKRIAKIEEEEEKTAKAIDRQERRAEQGLENNLAFEQKKAAELEKQREDEAKKQEQRAKVLAYFNLFSEFAKAEPNTAAFKAAAQVAIAETVSGLFYEGTEKVEDDIQGKPMFSGRDGYVVRVDGSERIMTGAQNSKLGGISNDDLVELATNGSGQVGYAVGIDTRKLESKLDSVIKAVQSNDKSVHWDSLGNRFETQIKNEVKKVTKHKKRIS